MDNSVQFVRPGGILQEYVDHYYFMELNAHSSEGEIEQKPLSNACVELFIGYQNTKGTCYTNGGDILRSATVIAGIHDLKNNVFAKALETDPKTLKFVTINFKINGFYGIFKIPPSELYNGFFESDLVVGPDIKCLQSKLDNAKNISDKKEFVEKFLLLQLFKNAHKNYRIDAGFKMTEFIKQHHGNLKIKNLISEFRLTERTLQRNLKSALGLSPKELCKIIRFNAMFNCIANKHKTNWMDMVSWFGYYDQSHLISEFKDATGTTPEIFVKSKNIAMFKIMNHLVLLKPTIISSDVQRVMEQGHGFEF